MQSWNRLKKKAIENKASEAAVRANAFESRMTETALNQQSSVAPSVSAAPPGNIDLSNQDVDLSNVDAAQVEEQRAILEEIERQKKQKSQNAGNAFGTSNAGGYLSPDIAPPSTQNPVIQESVREAIQMEEDRRLAEQLQQEENAAVVAETSNNATQEESSWWDTIAGAMGGATGTAPSVEDYGDRRSAEINVSHPPGFSMTPSQRALHGSLREDYERQALNSGTSAASSRARSSAPPAGRVAESKPLFSCVVDSVASAATAATSAATAAAAYAYGEDDEELNGVDTTSFLNVGQVGDDRESSGNYNQL